MIGQTGCQKATGWSTAPLRCNQATISPPWACTHGPARPATIINREDAHHPQACPIQATCRGTLHGGSVHCVGCQYGMHADALGLDAHVAHVAHVHVPRGRGRPWTGHMSIAGRGGDRHCHSRSLSPALRRHESEWCRGWVVPPLLPSNRATWKCLFGVGMALRRYIGRGNAPGMR